MGINMKQSVIGTVIGFYHTFSEVPRQDDYSSSNADLPVPVSTGTRTPLAAALCYIPEHTYVQYVQYLHMLDTQVLGL